ncbi:outer membrane beta-barrel protein [Chitinophaga japonensis]
MGIPLVNASVVLLQEKDSFIVADTRTDEKGRFLFDGLADTAAYILFLSYPGYAAYSQKVEGRWLREGTGDLGTLGLVLKSKLLREVIVRSQVAAIRIKGDTTEYSAAQFKLQPNATVEELLRQLPGLQVDQYGNITAQGQKVKKVLVDGEEFFGDDPTLVTRNLRADMIDKVQVYDRKSDAANFTGIDDGVRDRTINLKVREDKNHGVFGKADLGAGTNEHYNGQGMLNAFSENRKMAFFTTFSNTGRTGLGSSDRQKIGADGDGAGNYDGKGLPRSVSAGAHYNNKWNAGKESVNGNYTYNLMNIEGDDEVGSQNNLPTGRILSNSFRHFANRDTRQSANGKYVLKADTTSTITVYANGYLSDAESGSYGASRNRREDSTLIYDNESQDDNNYRLNSFNVNFSWEKQLKRKGRTLSLYVNNHFANDRSDGESRSSTDFFGPAGSLDSSSLLFLGKSMHDNWRSNSLKVYYTEPLAKGLSLILGYELGNSATHDDKRSYDLAKDPAATQMDAEFSSVVNSNTWANQGGAAINYALPGIIIRAGNDLKLVTMHIDDRLQQLALRKDFLNWNPTASIEVKVDKYRMLQVAYKGNSNSPERTQLLPLKFNNGQLATFLPNMELENSFTHKLSGSYNAARIMSNIYSGISGNVTLTTDPIAQAITVDPSGNYRYRSVNMNGFTNRAYYVNVYYSRKILPVDLQVGAAVTSDGGTAFSSINNAVNKQRYNTAKIGLELLKSKVRRYSAYLVAQGGYTVNRSSLQPENPNNYFSFELRPTIDIYFLKKFQLHTDAYYLWQQKTRAFNDNFDRMTWNAWIGANCLKNDQLTIKLSCNDILNQNSGYSRTANNTFFSENRYTTIRRFIMIGVTWNFTRFNHIKQQN